MDNFYCAIKQLWYNIITILIAGGRPRITSITEKPTLALNLTFIVGNCAGVFYFMQENQNQQLNINQEQDLCPVHEIPLEDGKCNQCGICYGCEGKM